MKRRMLTKEELIKNAIVMKERKLARCGTSFAIGCTSANYVLLTKENFYPKQIIEYNGLVRKYWDEFTPAKIDEYNDILFEKAEFKIEFNPWTIRKNKSQSYFNKMEDEYRQLDNDIFLEFQKYLLCHFMALIEMGRGKIRLTRNCDDILKLQQECYEDKSRFWEISKALEEKGVIVEFPNIAQNLLPDFQVEKG